MLPRCCLTDEEIICERQACQNDGDEDFNRTPLERVTNKNALKFNDFIQWLYSYKVMNLQHEILKLLQCSWIEWKCVSWPSGTCTTFNLIQWNTFLKNYSSLISCSNTIDHRRSAHPIIQNARQSKLITTMFCVIKCHLVWGYQIMVCARNDSLLCLARYCVRVDCLCMSRPQECRHDHFFFFLQMHCLVLEVVYLWVQSIQRTDETDLVVYSTLWVQSSGTGWPGQCQGNCSLWLAT